MVALEQPSMPRRRAFLEFREDGVGLLTERNSGLPVADHFE
jgi:hypothetical protein